jgi:putative FmdB family regulatory protein
MPVYEYTCEDCSRRFELFVQQRSMSDAVLCRHCRSPKVHKLVSTVASVGFAEDSFSAGDTGTGYAGCSGGACSCSTCG